MKTQREWLKLANEAFPVFWESLRKAGKNLPAIASFPSIVRVTFVPSEFVPEINDVVIWAHKRGDPRSMKASIYYLHNDRSTWQFIGEPFLEIRSREAEEFGPQFVECLLQILQQNNVQMKDWNGFPD